MTGAEIAVIVFRQLALVFLYFFLAFGSGIVFGILLANVTKGRGKPRLVDKHKRLIVETAEHHRQWHPSEERWQKE